jgi:hypothetical protein
MKNRETRFTVTTIPLSLAALRLVFAASLIVKKRRDKLPITKRRQRVELEGDLLALATR